MIKQIQQDITPDFPDSHYGRKLKSLFRAYGTNYDFCKFYQSDNDFIGIYNQNMIYTGNGINNLVEFKIFVDINSPDEIEVPEKLSKTKNFDGYRKINRAYYEFAHGSYQENMDVDENPRLDDVFDIVKEGFDVKDNYREWMTDISHRVRHGVSKCYIWNNTTATCHFIENNVAFFGQISTKQSERGKGNARQLLYYLQDKFAKQGITCALYAQQHRWSFYDSLGFKAIYTDNYYKKEE